MAEENLLETVREKLFIDLAEVTKIPGLKDRKLFTTPPPSVDPESEARGNKTPEDSEDEDNSKIAEFNAVPEKGAGGDDDDDDDDDDDGSDRRRTVVGSDDDDLIVATGEQDKIFGKRGEDRIKGNRRKKIKSTAVKMTMIARAAMTTMK